MSQLDAFVKHIQDHPELQERFKGLESDEVLIERSLAEGQALGYDLDADEIRQRLANLRKEAELSDAELENVSGGAYSDYPCFRP